MASTEEEEEEEEEKGGDQGGAEGDDNRAEGFFPVVEVGEPPNTRWM